MKQRGEHIWCLTYEILTCVCLDGEVPGSAVLVFDIELLEIEEGLPEGYMFIWNEDVSPDLFTEMDTDKDLQVVPSEVSPPQTHLLLNYVKETS